MKICDDCGKEEVSCTTLCRKCATKYDSKLKAEITRLKREHEEYARMAENKIKTQREELKERGRKISQLSQHDAYIQIWEAMDILHNVEDYLALIPESAREHLYNHPILKDFDLLP